MHAHLLYANLRRRRCDIAEQREILRRCGIPHDRHRPAWYRQGRHRLRHLVQQWQWTGGVMLYGRVGSGRDLAYRVDA